MSSSADVDSSVDARLPEPPSERRAWVLAGAVVVVGVCVLVAVLTGLVGQTASRRAGAARVGAGGAGGAGAVGGSPIVTVTATLATAADGTQSAFAESAASTAAIVAAPGNAEQKLTPVSFVRQTDTQTHIPAGWVAGFYPIYAEAQRTFGVNWLLLASIHRQESAFSTAPSTYHGLNFAGCCGGPMQFNVTNGPVSTWALVEDSYLYGHRPASYDHPTAGHPSIYDDFDSLMAAARLLTADGATLALDGGAWSAAYDYYGHDADGIAYADQVLARAIGWSQHGFCINCATDPSLVAAVHAAYGAPVAEASATAAIASSKQQG
jgi:hypothetical protein